MAAAKLKVFYLDGREVEVIASPRAQVEAERALSGFKEEQKVYASYYLAWLALNKSGKEPADFETWLDLIEDAEEVPATPRPTQPAPSGATSSD